MKAEADILGPFFEDLEIARHLRRRTLSQVATRARISKRTLAYYRKKKTGLTLRRMIELAAGCGVRFTVKVTVPAKTVKADPENRATSAPMEGFDDR